MRSLLFGQPFNVVSLGACIMMYASVASRSFFGIVCPIGMHKLDRVVLVCHCRRRDMLEIKYQQYASPCLVYRRMSSNLFGGLGYLIDNGLKRLMIRVYVCFSTKGLLVEMFERGAYG